jgi:hypothetical protein
LIDRLVKLDCRPVIARSGDYNVSPFRKQTIENLDTDGAFADTSQEGVLVVKGGAGYGNLV